MNTYSSRQQQHQDERLPSAPVTQEPRQPREELLQKLWPNLRHMLKLNPGPESKALCDAIRRRFPGRFPDNELLRALEEEVKAWEAVTSPCQDGWTDSVPRPGQLGVSDFFLMDDMRIVVAGRQFDHMIHYFILPYSNWETGTVCISNSTESLSQGLQNALWELGGVPENHGTLRQTIAVSAPEIHRAYQRRYRALLAHYGVEARAIHAADLAEPFIARNYQGQFKQAVEKTVVRRGSRAFDDRAAYERFLRGLFARRNGGRMASLAAERPHLRDLPMLRVDAGQRLRVRVSQRSTIRVRTNTYSVPSRLIAALIDVYITADCIELRQGEEEEIVETLPRIRGQNQRSINSRHVMSWLASDPKAFASYPYPEALFPTSRFRRAYDELHSQFPPRAREKYRRILSLAANNSEAEVDAALGVLLEWHAPISAAAVEEHLHHVERMRRASEAVVAT